jgi:excisionase family DNA binding protein
MKAFLPPMCLSVDAAAAHVSVSRDMIYDWVNAGNLTLVKVGPRRSVILREQLESLVLRFASESSLGGKLGGGGVAAE